MLEKFQLKLFYDKTERQRAEFVIIDTLYPYNSFLKQVDKGTPYN